MTPEKFPGDRQRQAIHIAQLHLKKFNPLFGKRTPLIGEVYPMYAPSARQPDFYDVILRDEDGGRRGWITVSLMEEFPPVLKFSRSGPSDIEILRRTIGHSNFRPIFFSPLFIVAEGERGKYLGHFGEVPAIYPDRGGKKRGFQYREFKRCYLETVQKEFERMAGDTKGLWGQIRPKRTSAKKAKSASDYLTQDELPDLNFQIVRIHHPERLPRYNQVPANAGANSAHDYKSGCAACAWMVLIGHHDNTYTPDLLRGTHILRGEDDSYLSREMVALSEFLGTVKDKNSDGGALDQGLMDRGFDFIRDEMGYVIQQAISQDGGGTAALQVVYDAICDYHSPSVINIPGHSMVAHEVLVDLSENGNDHYLKAYRGWSGSGVGHENDPYYPYTFLTGAWTLNRIVPDHDYDTGQASQCAPAVLEIGDPEVVPELVLGVRLPNEHIGLMYSQDGKTFDLKYEISTTGHTPPSLTVEPAGDAPYVAWKNAKGTLRLARVSPTDEQIIELPAPPEDSLAGEVGPVIQVYHDKLFYFWDTNVYYVPLASLETIPQPWPDTDGYFPNTDSFRSALGMINPLETPCVVMVEDDRYAHPDKLYYSFKNQRSFSVTDEMLILFVGTLDTGDPGDVLLERDRLNNEIYPGMRSILYFKDILYGTNTGPIAEYDGNYYTNMETELKYFPEGIATENVRLGVFSGYEIGPSALSAYLKDGNIWVRYHSIDSPENPLDYTGWPDY